MTSGAEVDYLVPFLEQRQLNSIIGHFFLSGIWK